MIRFVAKNRLIYPTFRPINSRPFCSLPRRLLWNNRSADKHLLAASPLSVPKLSILRLKVVQNLKVIFFILSGLFIYQSYDLFVNKNDKHFPIGIGGRKTGTEDEENKKKETNPRDLIYDDLLENSINLFYLDSIIVQKKINSIVRKHLFVHPQEQLTLSRRKDKETKYIGPVDQRFDSVKILVPSEHTRSINWYEQTYVPVKYARFSYSKQNPEEQDDGYKFKVSKEEILTLNPISMVSKIIDSITTTSKSGGKTPEKEVMYMPGNKQDAGDADGGLHFPPHSSPERKYTLFIADKLYVNRDRNRQVFYRCSVTSDLKVTVLYLEYAHRNERNQWVSEVVVSS